MAQWCKSLQVKTVLKFPVYAASTWPVPFLLRLCASPCPYVHLCVPWVGGMLGYVEWFLPLTRVRVCYTDDTVCIFHQCTCIFSCGFPVLSLRVRLCVANHCFGHLSESVIRNVSSVPHQSWTNSFFWAEFAPAWFASHSFGVHSVGVLRLRPLFYRTNTMSTSFLLGIVHRHEMLSAKNS